MSCRNVSIKSVLLGLAQNCRLRTGRAKKSVALAGEEACDDNQEHGADSRGGERINESSAEDFEPREDPSSENCANEPQNNVCDAAEAVSARDFPRQPARDQADEQPANQPMAEFNDPWARLKRSREHRASAQENLLGSRHFSEIYRRVESRFAAPAVQTVGRRNFRQLASSAGFPGWCLL